MKTCSNCLITDNIPGVEIKDAICKECFIYLYSKKKVRTTNKDDDCLTKLWQDISSNDGEYNCLLPLSGGKDSLYLARWIKVHLIDEQKLDIRPLLYTMDYRLNKVSKDNIDRLVDKYKLDHCYYIPSQNDIDKVLGLAIINRKQVGGAINSADYAFADIMHSAALKEAKKLGINHILTGVSPNQTSIIKFNYPKSFISNPIRPKFKIPQEFQYLFWTGEKNSKMNIFAPLQCFSDYNHTHISNILYRDGIIKSKKNSNPMITNNSFIWLCVYFDLIENGYNPFLPEFAKLIREGKASRFYWKWAQRIFNCMILNRFGVGRNIDKTARELGVVNELYCI